MPYIQITIAEGRPREVKDELMLNVAQAAASSLNVSINHVRAWIIEVPVSDMSIAGVPLDEVRSRRAAGDNSL